MLGYLLVAVAAAFASAVYLPIPPFPTFYYLQYGFVFAGVILIARESGERIAKLSAALFFVLLTAYTIIILEPLFIAAHVVFFVGLTAYFAWREKSMLLATSAALYAVAVATYTAPLYIPASLLAWYATRHITY